MYSYRVFADAIFPESGEYGFFLPLFSHAVVFQKIETSDLVSLEREFREKWYFQEKVNAFFPDWKTEKLRGVDAALLFSGAGEHKSLWAALNRGLIGYIDVSHFSENQVQEFLSWALHHEKTSPFRLGRLLYWNACAQDPKWVFIAGKTS